MPMQDSASDEHPLEPENPFAWSKSRKWILTGFSCLMCFMIGINALAISSATEQFSKRFGISDASFPNSYWVNTAWNGGAAIAPLLGLPFMEDFGVRTGYLTSYSLFIIFVIPQAVAQNFSTLLAARFFSGAFGSIVQNGVANLIGDLWVQSESSLPVTLFIYAYLLGFTFGPIFGSVVATHISFRWISYIQLIAYGVLWPVSWILVKETRRSILIRSHARDVAKKEGMDFEPPPSAQRPNVLEMLYNGAMRPLQLFFTEPVTFFFCLWCGLAIGNIFIASQSIAQTFKTSYGVEFDESGYLQTAIIIGLSVGLVICMLQNRIWDMSAFKNQESPGWPIPESRLQLSIPCSFIGMAGGLFVYGWTNKASISWIAPSSGLVLMGVGIMSITETAAVYLTDSYGSYSGSVIAAAAFVENVMSAFLPLSAQSMYSNLGFEWASSLLGFFALILSLAPVLLYWKGESIRSRSKFMRSSAVMRG